MNTATEHKAEFPPSEVIGRAGRVVVKIDMETGDPEFENRPSLPTDALLELATYESTHRENQDQPCITDSTFDFPDLPDPGFTIEPPTPAPKITPAPQLAGHIMTTPASTLERQKQRRQQ